MFYHSFTVFTGGTVMDNINLSKELAISKVAIPYVNRQVITESFTDLGDIGLVNLGAATILIFIKTESKIKELKNLQNPTASINMLKSEGHQVKECTSEILYAIPKNLISMSVANFNLSISSKQVFIIMKFGDNHLDSAYRGGIKPIVESFGLDVLRVDEIQDSGLISDQILKEISNSKYVIVDLSGERPNCYYEAGYAKALGKDVIFMIRKGEKVHFDLIGYRFIVWETEQELREKLKERLESLESASSNISIGTS